MSSVNRTFAGALAGSESTLRPTNKTLGGIATSPDLTANEVARLNAANNTILQLRLRRENPILERVSQKIQARLEGGAEVKPLSRAETSALMQIIGSVSHAENELLKQLESQGLISKENFDAVVVPHRDASNTAQAAQFSKLKWGAAAFMNFTSPMAIAYLAGSLLGGPVGAIAAGALALGVGVGITPKVHGVIQKNANAEAAVLGMNLLSGSDQLSELTMLTARASRGTILADNGQPLVERLRTEVELGTMLVDGRSYAKLGLDDLEQKIAAKVGKYHEGLAALLEKADAGQLTEAQLRSQIVALRAELLDAKLLDRTAREVAGEMVSASDESRSLHYLEAAGLEQGPAIIADIERLQGASVKATRDAAGQILTLASQIDGSAGVPPSQKLIAVLTKVLEGDLLTAADRGALKAEVQLAKAKHQEMLPELLMSEDESRAKTKSFLELIFTQVVGSLTGEERPMKIKDMRSDSLEGGGFVVSGKFAGDGWFSKSGSFSVRFDQYGAIDTTKSGSIAVDLGADNIAVLGAEAIRRQLELMGVAGKAKKPFVTERGAGEDKRYEVSGEIKKSDKSSYRFDMTPVGFVDWQSMKVS